MVSFVLSPSVFALGAAENIIYISLQYFFLELQQQPHCYQESQQVTRPIAVKSAIN